VAVDGYCCGAPAEDEAGQRLRGPGGRGLRRRGVPCQHRRGALPAFEPYGDAVLPIPARMTSLGSGMASTTQTAQLAVVDGASWWWCSSTFLFPWDFVSYVSMVCILP
jgi:hypothetical protein